MAPADPILGHHVLGELCRWKPLQSMATERHARQHWRLVSRVRRRPALRSPFVSSANLTWTFHRVSKEKTGYKDHHALVDDGYNIGRDMLVARALAPDAIWEAEVVWVQGLIEPGIKGVLHISQTQTVLSRLLVSWSSAVPACRSVWRVTWIEAAWLKDLSRSIHD